ncbi:hypothetical protein RI367_000118 [Sorochytrium milnesiophthora]
MTIPMILASTCLALGFFAAVVLPRLWKAIATPAAGWTQGLKRDCTHRLYIGSTQHARFYPRKHKFTYPVIYVGLSLDRLHELSTCSLFGHNRWRLFSIWDTDYLADIRKPPGLSASLSLKDKLFLLLESKGIDTSTIGDVMFLSTPRFMGYSFNPLSVYYCFGKGEMAAALVIVLLEVNNTFNERHIYVCCNANRIEKVRKGYTDGYRIERSFHVSPFNDRSGLYYTHVLSPYDTTRLDIRLVMYRTDGGSHAEPSREHKHLVAVLQGEAFALNTANLGLCALQYPFTVFLTVPRIMYEAACLAYSQKLWIFARPEPLTGQDLAGTAQTIVHQRQSTFSRYAQHIVCQLLESRAKALGLGVSLTRPEPGAEAEILVAGSEHLHIQLRNYAFFPLLLLSTSVQEAVLVSYTRGDIDLAFSWHGKPSADAAEAMRALVQLLCSSHDTRRQHVLSPVYAYLRRAMSTSLGPVLAERLRPRKTNVFDALIDLSIGQQLQLLRMLVQATLVELLRRRYFANAAKFAWNPFALHERIKRYLPASARDGPQEPIDTQALLRSMLAQVPLADQDDVFTQHFVQRYQNESRRCSDMWSAIAVDSVQE